ncbi:putative UDP-glucosyl transferase 72E1 [Hibiscus syriacus]|uniref:UDP-glucosyl transferase 72E1 n=1 Tax=Hibiscus syriacus TaxID=106335 RepID=A0A6A2XQI8_HIBSY|nr:putative UDP-glucosyl transferase 72E1 [Hibiscus syriacus]
MESHPTALVVDMFGTSALGIADEFNMLKFVCITSNARLFSVMLCTPEMDRKEIDYHVKKQKPLNIPGCKPLKFEDTTEVSLSDGISVNTWDEIEPTCLKALRDAKKVPCWSTKLAWGLELRQQRFVWVARPPIENDAAGNFLTLGNGSNGTLNYLPEGFSARTQDRGLVIPMWAPQVEILSHPSIGGFLTHGGWNSALESIINGVPMIAWPLYSEQKMNANILTEDIGASIRVTTMKPDGVVGREEIRSMVRKILIDHEGRNIQTRIKELKNSATRALVEGGSSYNSLSQVAEICIQCLKTKAYGA